MEHDNEAMQAYEKNLSELNRLREEISQSLLSAILEITKLQQDRVGLSQIFQDIEKLARQGIDHTRD